MAALSNTESASLLNTSLRSGTVYLALFLTDPTAGGTGTEASGGGYARKIITFSAPTLAGGTQTCSNSTAVDFGEFSANIGTIPYFGIYDALSGGNLKWFGAFDRSKLIEAGDSVILPAGGLTVELS